MSYTRTAFLDMTGRETRLPLKLRGNGMGPKAQFSFDSYEVFNLLLFQFFKAL